MAAVERIVLLCGGSTSLDVAIARELVRAGFRLLVHAAAGAGANAELFEGTLPRSSEPTFLQCDALSMDGCEAVVRAAWEVHGRVDALVLHPVIPMSDRGRGRNESWRASLSSGLKWPFFLARAAGLRLRESGGRIIVVAGHHDEGADEGPGAEVVRGGLVTMARGLARALPATVSVSAVVGGDRAWKAGSESDETRTVTADDVARAVRFLVIDDAAPSGTVVELGGVLSSSYGS